MPDLLRKLRGVAEAAEEADEAAKTSTGERTTGAPVRDVRKVALPWLAFGIASSVALALVAGAETRTTAATPRPSSRR